MKLEQLLIFQIQATSLLVSSSEWRNGDPAWLKRDKAGRFAKQDSVSDGNVALDLSKELSITDAQSQRLVKILFENGINVADVIESVRRNKNLPSNHTDITIDQRLKEIAQLADKPSKQVDLEWRVGIVKSEIKYGESINDLLRADIFDVIPYNYSKEDALDSLKSLLKEKDIDFIRSNPKLGRAVVDNALGEAAAWNNFKKWDSPPAAKKQYDRFMSLLKTGKAKRPGNVNTLNFLIGDVFNDLEKIEEPSAKEFFQVSTLYYHPDREFVARRQEEARKEAVDFTSIVKDPPKNVHIVSAPLGNNNALVTATPYMLSSKNNSYLSIGDTPAPDMRELVFHEMGHAVESQKNLSSYTWNYIDDRKSKRYTPMPYKYSYIKIPGQEEYPAGSEVISTVTQMLGEPKDLHRIASIDRDHLMFALWALDR